MLSSRPSRSNSSSLSSMVAVLWILIIIIMPTNVHSFGNNNNNNNNINNIGNAIFDGILSKTLLGGGGGSISSKKNKKINTNQSVTNILFDKLNKLIQQSPKNGINTPKELESEILRIAQALGKANPTGGPTTTPSSSSSFSISKKKKGRDNNNKSSTTITGSPLINGYWKMLWTNFEPAAPSSGKLGPFVGDVYQEIDLPNGIAKNILKVDIPPIVGCLTADAKIANENTIAISFNNVGNKIFGTVPLGPNVKFEEGSKVRLWEHIYLDDTYRILYARRVTDIGKKGFLYIMKRCPRPPPVADTTEKLFDI